MLTLNVNLTLTTRFLQTLFRYYFPPNYSIMSCHSWITLLSGFHPSMTAIGIVPFAMWIKKIGSTYGLAAPFLAELKL
jgi:hypothetical protein